MVGQSAVQVEQTLLDPLQVPLPFPSSVSREPRSRLRQMSGIVPPDHPRVFSCFSIHVLNWYLAHRCQDQIWSFPKMGKEGKMGTSLWNGGRR